MGIRIGVDIGIASVGWAVVDDEYQVLTYLTVQMHLGM